MSLNDRKGYALQALYYASIRAAPNNVAGRDIAMLSQIVRDLARNAMNGDAGEDLDRFLESSIARIRTSFDVLGRAEDRSDVDIILGLMRQRLAGIQCSRHAIVVASAEGSTRSAWKRRRWVFPGTA